MSTKYKIRDPLAHRLLITPKPKFLNGDAGARLCRVTLIHAGCAGKSNV